MSQKKKHSFLEACIGTAIGYVIAFTANLIILPFFGFKPSLHDNFWITNFFTAISVVRSYYVRRLFNLLHARGVL